MTKSKSAKRKRNTLVEIPNKLVKLSKTITPPPDKNSSLEPKSLHALISDEELETTIETLSLLTDYPNIIKSKACKDLRVVVWEFRQACTIGVNSAGKFCFVRGFVQQNRSVNHDGADSEFLCSGTVDSNLTGRITAAITDGKYTDARIGLAEMRIKGEKPKLGALCRWVRDLDVVSGLSRQNCGEENLIAERTSRDKELLVVLDAILRVAGPVDSEIENTVSSPGPIALQKLWDVGQGVKSNGTYESVLDRSIFSRLPAKFDKYFRVIETTPGPLRKPPNHHPAMLYASEDDILLKGAYKTIKDHHPILPGLSIIRDILSPSECLRIIAAAESIGFSTDAPIQEADSDNSSILAHNFYWLVDETFSGKLWERVRPHVPEVVDGKKARGLNRRFRIYRYVPGAEYRCHIDGAWPPSGIDPVTKAYVYDSSSASARQSSLFTFLIYLNDEFEGGETTFFMPSAREGVMNAYPVKPVMGGVAMFPHGETAGALLHEGTGVKSGAKYVIRTDVLYDVDATA